MAKARKPLPRSTKPLKRSEPSRARKPIKVRGKPRFKGRVDEAFREYIRGLSCVLKGNDRHGCWGEIECCHLKARSTGGADRGNCFPACAWAHARQHDVGIKTFQEYYGIDLAKLAAELGGRYTREHDA